MKCPYHELVHAPAIETAAEMLFRSVRTEIELADVLHETMTIDAAHEIVLEGLQSTELSSVIGTVRERTTVIETVTGGMMIGEMTGIETGDMMTGEKGIGIVTGETMMTGGVGGMKGEDTMYRLSRMMACRAVDSAMLIKSEAARSGMAPLTSLRSDQLLMTRFRKPES